MVSIRGWIILHAFHLPVFSACVVVDLVMGLNTAFSTFLGRSVSRRRSWVNRFCWGCCACGVDYRCDCVADAVPSGGGQRRSGSMDFEVCGCLNWSKMHVRHQSCTTDHFVPLLGTILVHSARFAVIAGQCPCQQKGCPRVEGTPRNTPLSLPMASGLFTGRSRRNVRPVDRSSRRGHWTRRS